MTRAKKELIITSNKYRSKATKWENRYLKEIQETGLAKLIEVA